MPKRHISQTRLIATNCRQCRRPMKIIHHAHRYTEAQTIANARRLCEHCDVNNSQPLVPSSGGGGD